MKKIIELFKKQKIIIILSLLLLVLLFLKLLAKRPDQTIKPKESPAPLEREKELIVPKKESGPERKPGFLEKESPAPTLKEKVEEKTKKEEVEIPYDPAGEALEEALKERPWLIKLPIKEKNYTIDYLESKQSFRVLMTIDITSPLSREEQIANIKTEAPKKLEEIGIDLNKEKIYYTFTP